MSVKPAYKRITKDLNDYVNVPTGETMKSELPNVTSLNVIDDEYFIIDSKEYVIVDKIAMSYLEKILPAKDMTYVYRMTNMCSGIYNILHTDEKKMHTRQTLQKEFNLASTRFKTLMKSLKDNSIIGYMDVTRNKQSYKHIVLNPTLARCNKRLHADAVKPFEDLTAYAKDAVVATRKGKQIETDL